MGQHEIGCFGTRKELGIKPETLVVAAQTWENTKDKRNFKDAKQVSNKADVYKHQP